MRLTTTILLLAAVLVLAPTAQAQTAAMKGQRVACSNGSAANYGCSSVDLMGLLPGPDLVLPNERFQAVNDIWGWTDPDTRREYAIVGRNQGTSFVDVTDPINPVLLGVLPRHQGSPDSIWRDMKTYNNYAFIVADAAGLHGMQVFDLTQLRGLTGDTPVEFEETAHYGGFGSAHNIVINEETGFAYAVGSSGGESCGGGLHMINIQIPDVPRFVGCFADEGTGRRGTGYTHDAQCTIYRGPDPDYQGREICVASNETVVSIVDVTDKANPRKIARVEYPSIRYAHQGWLTEDQAYFLLDDELDEGGTVGFTRTLFFDFEDLDDPLFMYAFDGTTTARDHNQYIRGNYAFQANYAAGLRILDISDISNPKEVAFFDTHIPNDVASFAGAWSNYPYFESGNVMISSAEGLFVVQPVGLTGLITSNERADELPQTHTFAAAYPNPFTQATTLELTVEATQNVAIQVFDMLGRQVATLHEGVIAAGAPLQVDFRANGLPAGLYIARATGASFTASQVLARVD